MNPEIQGVSEKKQKQLFLGHPVYSLPYLLEIWWLLKYPSLSLPQRNPTRNETAVQWEKKQFKNAHDV